MSEHECELAYLFVYYVYICELSVCHVICFCHQHTLQSSYAHVLAYPPPAWPAGGSSNVYISHAAYSHAHMQHNVVSTYTYTHIFCLSFSDY